MEVEFTGFVDLQVNGFAGIDFNDPTCTHEQLQFATNAIATTGITLYLPTLITSSLERFSRCARTIAEFNHPAIVGIHMEGPYIAPHDGPRGAHPKAHVTSASIDDFQRRQDAAQGRIVLVTLAPEVPGALRLIEYLVSSNVRAAIGHTHASPEQIRDAITAGTTLSTHLGNGCAQVLPRHPNFIWEQLAADELLASLICDGHHLPPSTVKAMVRAKSPSRIALVTDATSAAAACSPGFYTIGEERIELNSDGCVRAPGAPNLAGSALTMNRAIENAVRFTGLSLDEVLPMASTIPATYLGIPPRGRIFARWNDKQSSLLIDEVNVD